MNGCKIDDFFLAYEKYPTLETHPRETRSESATIRPDDDSDCVPSKWCIGRCHSRKFVQLKKEVRGNLIYLHAR